jgi:hypothetical protein
MVRGIMLAIWQQTSVVVRFSFRELGGNEASEFRCRGSIQGVGSPNLRGDNGLEAKQMI